MSCARFPKPIRKVTETQLYPEHTPSGLPTGVPAHRCLLPTPVEWAAFQAKQKESVRRYQLLAQRNRCC